MIPESNGQAAIIRTERGLTIAGTRITLYDVMDYVTDQYPSKFIRGLFDLTEKQVNAALSYIEANRAEVEAEYQQVLKEAEELRQYYEEQNRGLVARIAAQSPKPGTEAAWEKLRAAKAKRESKPVITVSNADRLLNDSEYRGRCVESLIEIVLDMDTYQGARRIFIP